MIEMYTNTVTIYLEQYNEYVILTVTNQIIIYISGNR